jgi:hypothetical protein
MKTKTTVTRFSITATSAASPQVDPFLARDRAEIDRHPDEEEP